MPKLTIVANIKANPDKVDYENWESRDLWQTHMQAQHLRDYVTATEGAVEAFALNEMTHIA